MADNVTLNSATVAGGKTIASEDIAGVQFQRVKLALGATGADLGDVSNVNPLTVQMGGASVGAFGDLITAENFPLVQLDFVYGINTQTGVSAVLNTGVADTNNSRLRLQTGTNSAGSAIFMSKRTAKYRAGQGMTVRFTSVFTTGAANSTQINGFGSATNGYFFGYNGSTFGVLHRNNGSDTWVAQSSWNGDKCNGAGVSAFTINPTLGNVFQIRYPYLGYGVITFWILNPTTGTWILCHTIQYPNTSATTQLSNPNLTYYAQVLNSGNTSNLTLYVGSVAALLTGQRSFVSNPRWAADASKAVTAAGGETAVLSIKNCTTYNTVTNRSLIRLASIAVGGQTSNTVVTIRLRVGATLGGSPAYTTIDGTTADNGVTITAGNSIASKDTAATTAAGGMYVFNLTMNGAGTVFYDLTAQDIFISPAEILTVSAQVGANATVAVGLNWNEDI